MDGQTDGIALLFSGHVTIGKCKVNYFLMNSDEKPSLIMSRRGGCLLPNETQFSLPIYSGAC